MKSEVRDAGQPGFWQGRWDTGQTGWDHGGAHDWLPEILAEARRLGVLPAAGRVLEPGCGRAHNGAALARLGYQVTSFDLIPAAIEAARAVYGQVPGLELAVADALSVRQEWRGRFQMVFDRAMLCALPRQHRAAYARTLFESMAPGALLLSLPFVKVRITEEEGPPFAVTIPELSSLLAPWFALEAAAEREVPDEAAAGGKILREAYSFWRRRPAALGEGPR